MLKRAAAYGDVRGLRKLEAGELQPKRKAIIELLYEALEERDPAVFDELLSLAGYRGLNDQEKSRLSLAAPQVPEVQPMLPPHYVPEWLRWLWRGLIIGGFVATVLAGWGCSGFEWISSLMFSGLFTVSVLLETANEFHGRETIEAAGAAAAIMLPASLAALRFDSRGALMGHSEYLIYALFVIVIAALTQWLLVRPALPSYTIVQTKFQTQPAQAAHLKNTAYFLVLAFLFWLPPHHCREATIHHLPAAYCPPPLALWILLVCVIAGTIPMGSRLLDSLQPSAHQNAYITLFWIRALLFFALSAMNLLLYSIAGS